MHRDGLYSLLPYPIQSGLKAEHYFILQLQGYVSKIRRCRESEASSVVQLSKVFVIQRDDGHGVRKTVRDVAIAQGSSPRYKQGDRSNSTVCGSDGECSKPSILM